MNENLNKIESVLIKNWAQIFNIRHLISLTNEEIKDIQKASVSRFEPTSDGFIIWLEYTKRKGNSTAEFILNFAGDITLIQIV